LVDSIKKIKILPEKASFISLDRLLLISDIYTQNHTLSNPYGLTLSQEQTLHRQIGIPYGCASL
ncbi:MAG: hypothetical protein P8M77_07445, partial [Porticoccaceae bacterium]|nr:hypothetical protein [Porticoccaceae bacterium]